MKLIDTVYIHMGGGAVLLDLMIRNFGQQEDLCFLFDIRYSPRQFPKHYKFIKYSEIERWKFYCGEKKNLSSVFCFANVPPPFRLKVPVFTYFHNHVVVDIDKQVLTKKQVLLYLIKQQYIKSLKSHTNLFIVQTKSFAESLSKHIGVSEKKLLCPFWEDGKYRHLAAGDKNPIAFGYVSLPYPHKQHDKLLTAWELLAQKGCFPTLHLTAPDTYSITPRINALKEKGIAIINHGLCDPSEIYKECKYQIFPSSRESFGLGLIEAIDAGCRVITPNLPYVLASIKPSYTWKITTPESIADAVLYCLSHEIPQPEIVVQNEWTKLASLINI
jgi:glycosyltransferase involved in cell wall biosynthesis